MRPPTTVGGQDTVVRVATWNLEWTSPRSRRAPLVHARVDALDADILVATEATIGILPDGGHRVDAGADWGYVARPDRRKVTLWSRWPIVAAAPGVLSPAGRHVAATMETDIGPVRVHAVCVPWALAHVASGRRDRAAWADHVDYLDALPEVLAADRESGLPLVVAGDINQHAGASSRAPQPARERWAACLAAGDLRVVTDEQLVDQVAASTALHASEARSWAPGGLSDHHAVAVTLR